MKRILAAVVLALAALGAWADSVTTTALGTSTPLAAGPGAKVTLTPSGGTARVEYTTGSLSAIANNVATWTTWPNGTVSAASIDTAAFPMFVRVVGVTGSGTLSVDAADPTSVAYQASRPWTSQVYGVPMVLCKSAVAVSVPVDTSEDILATCTVPANAMGANGVLRIRADWTYTNNANNKTMRIRFSGGAGTLFWTLARTTQTPSQSLVAIGNRGATNSQFGLATLFDVTQGAALATATSAVDTTAATNIVITGQKATAGDTLTLESFLIELMPSN